MARRVFVHIGLPKTATSYLQTILWTSRDRLRADGLLLPGTERRDHLWASRVIREGDPEWRDDVPVRVETIPVRRADRVIAVVARNTNLQGVRTPSRLELSYLQTAGELTEMIAHGSFPFEGERSDHTDSPRVGDGFVRIDAAGRVSYASPNAQSVYRRLGLSGDDEARTQDAVALVVPAMKRRVWSRNCATRSSTIP